MEAEQLPTVERAIDVMWRRYNEPLSLAEIAESAILSKFYFSRVFRSATGVSPGRFLAAVRLYQAKRLLLETSLCVTDIAFRVGYNSLGSFTSRFTRSVGTAPARYRMLAHADSTPLPARTVTTPAPESSVSMRGKICLPTTDVPVRVYIGAFNSPIMEGQPSSWDVLETSGWYHLDNLSEGRWHIHAAAVAVDDACVRSLRPPLFTGGCKPVTVRDGRTVHVDVRMQHWTPLDLPILLALPELDRHNTQRRERGREQTRGPERDPGPGPEHGPEQDPDRRGPGRGPEHDRDRDQRRSDLARREREPARSSTATLGQRIGVPAVERVQLRAPTRPVLP